MGKPKEVLGKSWGGPGRPWEAQKRRPLEAQESAGEDQGSPRELQ